MLKGHVGGVVGVGGGGGGGGGKIKRGHYSLPVPEKGRLYTDDGKRIRKEMQKELKGGEGSKEKVGERRRSRDLEGTNQGDHGVWGNTKK